jgi:uncharacterized protein YifN (PemK superfamily)
MKQLYCRLNPSHERFSGLQDMSVRYEVELAADSGVVARIERSLGDELTNVLDDVVTCPICNVIVHKPRLPINFVPDRSMVLLCNYSGFQKPEMTKVRPVVVLSPKMRNGLTVMVAAISTSDPYDRRSIVVALPEGKYPFLKASSFVKCEMVNTVRNARLYLLRGDDGRGIRSTETMLDAADMARVRAGILQGIGG